MKHFKQIMVTTDLSAESFSTVQYAAHLAKAQEAGLTIVHVPLTTTLLYPEFGIPLDLATLDREIEAYARNKIDDWVKRHVKKGDVATRVIVQHGVAHETICRIAEEIDASVIVMATHGRKGLNHILLGSVTERVLRDAPCPVLVVRPPAPVIEKKKAA